MTVPVSAISLSSSISVADCSTWKALFYLAWEKVLTGTTNPQSSMARFTGVLGSKEGLACCQSVVASSCGVSSWYPRGFLFRKPHVCTLGEGDRGRESGLLEAAAAQGDKHTLPSVWKDEWMHRKPFSQSLSCSKEPLIGRPSDCSMRQWHWGRPPRELFLCIFST